MTPLMLRVAEIVGRDAGSDQFPVPGTRRSTPTSVCVGADRQVALRALAEQLVCEANAVLAASDDRLSLSDELSGDELAFNVHYRGRFARVSTRFAGAAAYGRLLGDGVESAEPRELEGPAALPNLLMLLLVGSNVPRHPAGA